MKSPILSLTLPVLVCFLIVSCSVICSGQGYRSKGNLVGKRFIDWNVKGDSCQDDPRGFAIYEVDGGTRAGYDTHTCVDESGDVPCKVSSSDMKHHIEMACASECRAQKCKTKMVEIAKCKKPDDGLKVQKFTCM
jgi:hypothetical protein